MKISEVLFILIISLIFVFLYFNNEILDNVFFQYIETAGIIFNSLFKVILSLSIMVFIFAIYRKIFK